MNHPEEQTHTDKALLKKQRREEKQQQREKAARKAEQRRQYKKVVLWTLPVLLLAAGIWAYSRSPKTSDEHNPLISRSGIHWHADLAIVINGDRVAIPANIGLRGTHADMHTHEGDEQIHLEMSRPVRRSDTRLGNFFEVWGEEFSSQCILDRCNGEGGAVKMLVNGTENAEFENYHLQDGDTVEIRYE